ncbi:hypothetical protein BD626DRAFT_116868 [Schizophyllum amplum]|uniref:NTF2-like protein n=1 Tax=Schizophyllum amplum TaxID=97359 RepID=A0A550CUL7_9AGAR|nr:hypothetical protein BD626DRAFT_116868 [Auriculariopsis ampla]
MAPTFYDPTSPDEQEVKLPSAPRVTLSANASIQPPLTRRGTGPGMIMFLPATAKYLAAGSSSSDASVQKSLDPEPMQKWAEEGFAVVSVVDAAASGAAWTVPTALAEGLKALRALPELDTKDKFAIMVYDVDILAAVQDAAAQYEELVCVVTFAPEIKDKSPSKPTLYHLSVPTLPAETGTVQAYAYEDAKSPYFCFSQSTFYDPGSATSAHCRGLVFFRKHLGGPIFDIEAVWDEHTYFEFELRSVAKTMGTMVQEPYVNHVTTMTGGIGRKELTAFYRDHFIFSNPPDTVMKNVSRTVGVDRVVDEFIFCITHTTQVDWLLPGIPPTGKKMEIPMMGVINVRGDRLYHEHIWWDQGTALKQAGLMPDTVDVPGPNGVRKLKLPVADEACARLLVNESDGVCNEMLDWGFQD